MTWICKKRTKKAATHAAVIGVGHYPFCDKKFQLTAPQLSARAFAKWLLEDYNNNLKPLASLTLLISDKQNDKFTTPSGDELKISRATLKNVKTELKQWKKLCDLNKENMAIFFFCGHGCGSIPYTVLLLEDYRKDEDNVFENAIDFYRCHLGLDKCGALEQFYFIDSCRVISPEELRAVGPVGDPIFHPDVIQGEREAPIIYATKPGAEAYGPKNGISFYTSALLNTLKGAAADNVDGSWWVYSDRITSGINRYLKRTSKQRAIADGVSGSFRVHYVDGKPLVPVTVGCKPKDANSDAILSYIDDSKSRQREKRSSQVWEIDLEEGQYSFHAKFRPPHQSYHDNVSNSSIRPPFREISIKVKKR